jgi:hypothetical protein
MTPIFSPAKLFVGLGGSFIMSRHPAKCLGSLILLSVVTFLVVLRLAGCLATDHSVNRNANTSVQVNSNLPSSGDLIETDLYEFADQDLGNLIEEISPRLGLAPLAKTDPARQFEFRIWTNLGGLADPKLFGVRFNGTDNDAYFFEINRHPYSIKLRQDHLGNPKSGWNRTVFEVRSRLTTPKGHVRDPQFELMRDEPVILLEVLDKGEYRRVFYGKGTAFPDGKRLMQVCDYLSAEFELDLECHPQPAL